MPDEPRRCPYCRGKGYAIANGFPVPCGAPVCDDGTYRAEWLDARRAVEVGPFCFEVVATGEVAAVEMWHAENLSEPHWQRLGRWHAVRRVVAQALDAYRDRDFTDELAHELINRIRQVAEQECETD